MNLTCISLTLLSTFSNSPYFLASNYFSSNNFSIFRSYFSFSLNHLCYLSSVTNRLTISQSKFSFFLNSPITIEETYVTNARIKFDKVAIFDTTFMCKDSTFQDCKSISGAGGAITCLSSMILRNCLFQRCQSETGGAISSSSDIDFFSTSFIDCLAYLSGGCVDASLPDKIIVSFCTFCRSIASNAGALRSNGFGQTMIRYSNISSCGSFQNNGAFELHYHNVQMQNLIFEQCFSYDGTSGIELFQNDAFTLTSLFFHYMSGTSKSRKNIGLILTIMEPSKTSIISHCTFTRMTPISGLSIYFQPKDDNFGILQIIKCCFSLSKNFELGENITVFNDSERVSMFDANCDQFFHFALPRRMGYIEIVQETEAHLAEKVMAINGIEIFTNNVGYFLLAGFSFGFICWILFFIFCPRESKRRRRNQDYSYQLL